MPLKNSGLRGGMLLKNHMLMRKAFGRGTPRGLQGRQFAPGALEIALGTLVACVWTVATRLWHRPRPLLTVRPTSWTVVLAC